MQGDLRFDIGRLGDALTTKSIFRTSTFLLNLVDDALEAAASCYHMWMSLLVTVRGRCCVERVIVKWVGSQIEEG